MNPYLTSIQQLDDSDLTDRMVRIAISLLRRVNDRGELHITRADACHICGVEDANTVSKYLARLAAAGIVDWKGGNGAFHIWFVAWLAWAEVAPPAVITTPAAAKRAKQPAGISTPVPPQTWQPWAQN